MIWLDAAVTVKVSGTYWVTAAVLSAIVPVLLPTGRLSKLALWLTLTEIVWLVVRVPEGVMLSHDWGTLLEVVKVVGEGELMLRVCGAGAAPPCSPVNEKDEGLMVRRLGAGTVDSTSLAILFPAYSVNHMFPSGPEAIPAAVIGY
jgi:hypothetical protein